MRVLLVRNDHLGDLVLCLPVADALRRAGYGVVLCVAEGLQDLPGLELVADRVVWRRGGESLGSFAERLDAEGCGVMLVFAPGRENAALAARVRVPVKVGHAAKPYNWGVFNRWVTVRRSHPPMAETAYMEAFCRAAGLDVSVDRGFRLPWPSGVEDFRRRFGVGYVTVHPGGRGSAENLGPGEWMVLASGLARRMRGGRRVCVVLGPAEEGFEGMVRERLAGVEGAEVVTGLSLAGLAALVAGAGLVVSGSTGPMHLAAVYGARTFSFFPLRRRQSPLKWRPLGWRGLWASVPREGELERVAERVAEVAG